LITALRYAASLPNGSDLTELDQLKRRSFITLLGGVLAAWPLAAHAQQPDQMRRIGVLSLVASWHDRVATRLGSIFLTGMSPPNGSGSCMSLCPRLLALLCWSIRPMPQ
jgi:hypothetical protein